MLQIWILPIAELAHKQATWHCCLISVCFSYYESSVRSGPEMYVLEF